MSFHVVYERKSLKTKMTLKGCLSELESTRDEKQRLKAPNQNDRNSMNNYSKRQTGFIVSNRELDRKYQTVILTYSSKE